MIALIDVGGSSEFMGKTFQAAQLTHERFLTVDHSCKIFSLISAQLNFHRTFSTTHQRSVEVQFGRYQKNILQDGSMVKKLSWVSWGSLKRFPHKFTKARLLSFKLWKQKKNSLSGMGWVSGLYLLIEYYPKIGNI